MPSRAGEWYQAGRGPGPTTSGNAPGVDRYRTRASRVFVFVGPIVSLEVASDTPTSGRLAELYVRHAPEEKPGVSNLIEILSTIDLYEEIPAELYKAVAEVLAFIYKMSGRL